ncbi:carbohydrate-binding protein [Rugosimonospora africana]|uniref:Chitinase n=1 Tax=Rugosimonospora africana TaxID=556532 RepID=A0A8J3QZV3_9ACTN|nr:carbohydrate-binding protein [Rugosimonospora africana]GIH20359.1 chitinase [Rugosimonospora africana]
MRRARIITTVAAAGAMAGAAILSVTVGGTANAATLSSNWYGSAPYVMPLDNNPPDLPTVMAATGQKAFELAFVLAPNGGGCTPTWGGTAAVSSDTTVANIINGVRSHDGDVSVSIGGYGGTKLGQTCGTAAATAAAYQQVITKYSLKAIDFDLEEPEYENTAAINNEVGAAQILQRNNSGLYVSITTAGTAAGTGYFGQNVLNTAKALGFTPNNYSIMPFDGGFNGAASQTSALEAFHTLLMNTFGWSSATAYNHEGVSMMNGRSDAGEYFYQADFQTVLTYATGHGLSRYTFWAVNRDRACNPPSGSTSGVCSSVTQNDWDFTKYTARFAGATPPQSPPPTTGGPTTPPGSCSAPVWSAGTAYNGGAVVSYNGHTWTAKWWTQGDIPGNNSQGVWTDNGACTGGGGPTTPPAGGSCTGLTAWNSSTAYTGGAVVSYNGHKWTAKWWTQGDIPGNNSQGVWTDNGAC